MGDDGRIDRLDKDLALKEGLRKERLADGLCRDDTLGAFEGVPMSDPPDVWQIHCKRIVYCISRVSCISTGASMYSYIV